MALLNNVELKWCKCGDNAGTKYMSEEKQWSVDALCSKKQSADWVKSQHAQKERTDKDSNKPVIKLTKACIKRDGQPAQPIKCIDMFGNDIDPLIIGNGSKANVQYMEVPYDVGGNKGVKAILTAIQVTKLEEYAGNNGMEFDIQSQPEVSLEEDEVF
jgi:hypothetical protein